MFIVGKRIMALVAVATLGWLGGAYAAESGESTAERELREALKKANPEYDGKSGTLKLDQDGKIIEANFEGVAGISDISPLKGLPIKILSLRGTKVKDLKPLAGMPLAELNLLGCESVADLSPLEKAPLEKLILTGCGHVADLSPLRGAKLKNVGLNGCVAVSDLSPLKGQPIEEIHFGDTNVTDISPLKDAPLKTIGMGRKVLDIHVLKGKPLKRFELDRQEVSEPGLSDLSPLEDMPLEYFAIYHGCHIKDISPIKNAKLRYINLEASDVRDVMPLKGQPLEDADFCTSSIENTNLDMLAGMPLKGFSVERWPKLTDISAVKTMPQLAIVCLNYAPLLSDLSPLMEVKNLKDLTIQGCAVKDLSVLENTSLESLIFTPENFSPEQIAMLKRMKGLKYLNVDWTVGPDHAAAPHDWYFTAETFWKKYDAGEFKSVK